MSYHSQADRPRKLTLLLKREQPESERALELVRAYDPAVEVVYVANSTNGTETAIPSLHTPLSAFEGLPDIEAFIAAEKEYPVVKKYLRNES